MKNLATCQPATYPTTQASQGSSFVRGPMVALLEMCGNENVTLEGLRAALSEAAAKEKDKVHPTLTGVVTIDSYAPSPYPQVDYKPLLAICANGNATVEMRSVVYEWNTEAAMQVKDVHHHPRRRCHDSHAPSRPVRRRTRRFCTACA